MKTKFQVLFGASAVSMAAFSALAQEAYRPNAVTPSSHQRNMTGAMPKDRLNGAAKASDLIGMTVKDNQGVALGKVDDLAVDLEAGRLVQVILSTGGILGIGETLRAVPPGALHHDVVKKLLQLDADQEMLKNAPKFESSKWAENSDSNHVAQVYQHFHEQPWFASARIGDSDGKVAAQNQDGKGENSGRSGDQDTVEGALRQEVQTSDAKGTVAARIQQGKGDNPLRIADVEATDAATRQEIETSDAKGTVAAREEEGVKDVDGLNRDRGSTKTVSRGDDQSADGKPSSEVRNREGNWSKEHLGRETDGKSSDTGLGYVQKASKVMGMAVMNLEDEKIGTVDNLLVDISSGRLVAVIVSSGGFLGMNNELSAVPPAALRLTEDRSALHLDATKETLADAPHFKADRWPDFSQPSYSDNVYRSYRIEPYFTTNTTTEPDNTAINIRDRERSSLTPLDQGNSQQDIEATAQIRKAIMADKDMSMNAKNVKIITQQGHVTLRGVVNSAAEKARIDAIAANIATAKNVDNLLDVK
jgi:hyperosmotically inducible protein